MIKFTKKYPADKKIKKELPKVSSLSVPVLLHDDNYIWHSMCDQTASKYGREAGKGDTPRNCNSESFSKNYDLIDWSDKGMKVL
jgi:hypothetical protein